MGRWDVALSFAGAQRKYVEEVAEALKARGLRCFYDADEKVELWGKYLPDELPAIYGEQAAAVVVFLSAEYVARDWTLAERRAAFARAVRERREYVLPARFDDTPLPGLLQGMATVSLRTTTPQEFAAMIVEKLGKLGITGYGRPADLSVAHPAGAVRVSEAKPRLLGVHAAISVPEMADDVPPEYVPRDADEGQSGVRARVAAATDRGGFLLLVGGSSVGKTRCAVEAVKAELPDWWLVHPDGPAEVAALARAPLARTVVWLDELQRYLDGEDGLTAGMVGNLLNGPHPPLIIATLWPEQRMAYTARPSSVDVDPHARERQVLELATVVNIGPEFSPAERERARAAAARDRRLAIALDSAGDELTQILAAAPQLAAHWADARTERPYAWGVLTAALDVARLGGRAPLSAAFLEKAAPGYWSSRQLAEAPGDWFKKAVDYATAKLLGATAALTPSGTRIGQVAGYTAADYLIQQAARERRAAPVPASTWDAILTDVHDSADIARLAGSARGRLLYRYAIPLYRRVAGQSDEYAVAFARLMMDRGDPDEARRILEARTSAADKHDDKLTSLLADVNGLLEQHQHPRACADDEAAAGRRDGELADPSPDEPRDLADAGDLAQLRDRADSGDSAAAIVLDRLMADRGDLEQLRDRANARDEHAANMLAEVLADRGDLEQLRARAGSGDTSAARKLVDVLVDRGDLEQLRDCADGGDGSAAIKLVDVLAHRGDLTQLRARADGGDIFATIKLTDGPTGPDKLAELRDRANRGDASAAIELADALVHLDKLGELGHRGDAGDRFARLRLADVLVHRDKLDQLAHRADAGDATAAIRLATALAHRDELDRLQDRADAGDGHASSALAGVRAARGAPGDIAELTARADAGDLFAAMRLTDVLAARGDAPRLRARVGAGDLFAAMGLPGVMIRLGQRDEAEQLRRFGLNLDGSVAEAWHDTPPASSAGA